LPPVRDAVKDWLARAPALGVLTLLRAALLRIHCRLTNDPDNWGNPLYTLHHLGMTICSAVEWGIAVSFGVDVANRLVCVRQMQLMTSNPLNAPPGGGPIP
jgi:hypothetical protein